MQSCTFVFLATVVALALAEGQFYVPRSYYIIDSEGHESPPVPLRRLRRSLGTQVAYPNYPGYGNTANAHANAKGEISVANAVASSGWNRPSEWVESPVDFQGASNRPAGVSGWNLPGWNTDHGGAANPAYKH